MRLMMVVVLVAGLAGCGPNFKDDSEELRYLTSLSNPTVSQFQRKEELIKKFVEEKKRNDAEQRRIHDAEVEERMAKLDKELAEKKKSDEEWEKETAQRVLEGRRESARHSLSLAKEAENRGDQAGKQSACYLYKLIIQSDPDIPEAKQAAEAHERLSEELKRLGFTPMFPLDSPNL